MGFIGQPIPNWLQWFGLFASIAGTLLTVWAVVSARGARLAAELAREEAKRLGRLVELDDLLDGMQELQLLVEHGDFGLISSKANQLRGRIARFSGDAYNELSEHDAGRLATARDHLTNVIEVSAIGRGLPTNRLGKIKIALSNANAQLNVVLGGHRSNTSGVG